MPTSYLIWTAGLKGPEPQRWTDQPSDDYWGAKSGRVLMVVPLTDQEAGMSLDELARKHPGPAVRTEKDS